MTATKVDKTPVGAQRPGGEEWYPESSRSLESLRQMRLMALLRDMIEAEDGAKAAERLGVSYRTVSRTIESGRLTARMSAALERHLLLGGGSAAAQQREMIEALSERVESLETELRDGFKASQDRCEAAGKDQTEAVRLLERRLARLESTKGIEGTEETAQAETEKTISRSPWREHHELVTEVAEAGEELVYGEATTVIVEWRRATAEHRRAVATGTALERTEARMRALEIEIELIDTHKLTLPPATYPWDNFDRREQLGLRELYMENARRSRRRALLLRALTFGLWRK